MTGRIKHDPLHPPRPCTPGEGIYLQLWREWAEANPGEWEAIFCTNDRVGQRAASVAASFMVFMGCNGGYCFTREAEALAERTAWKERAFLQAWAADNARHDGINSGLRTIEYMLAAEYPIEAKTGGTRVNWAKVPAITMHDIDVVESMVRWWAGPAAKKLRQVSAPMIEAENRKRWSGMFGPAAGKEGNAA